MKPRALIVTIYGLYARETGGWLSVSTVIKLMAALDVTEATVRSSISRLKRRGILVAEKVDGTAGYSLSDHAREILRDGDRRIFERPRAEAGEGWVLAVFSVPEAEREKRHQLRSRLSWLGFGTVASGVWIAPAHLEREARDTLERTGLASFVDVFRAEYAAFGAAREKVSAWWDVDALEQMYDEFVASYGPVLATWRRRRDAALLAEDGAAFSDYVGVLTQWRRLPYLDPGLPEDLLPADWSGARAADLFFELRDRLASGAHRYVEAASSTA